MKRIKALWLLPLIFGLVACGDLDEYNTNRTSSGGDGITAAGFDGRDYLNPYSYLVLVNQYHRLDANFSPSDLRLLNVLDYNQQMATTIYLREQAATMAELLFQAAIEEMGLTLLAWSGYRSYQAQKQLHESFVNQLGQIEAERIVARPGHSEHQTGLALDVKAFSPSGLERSFGDTFESYWLGQNAHRFGFIIRYPEGREAETGFIYEPWHIRYVGIDAATEIYENNLILEEFLR